MRSATDIQLKASQERAKTRKHLVKAAATKPSIYGGKLTWFQKEMAEAPQAQAPTPVEAYQWAYSIVDSSRVSTFFISILLIVYGSFRSLALEEDKTQDTDAKDKDSKEDSGRSSGIQTLDSLQAMCLPLGASISLLVMFFFFDSMQMLFAICTAVIATVALAFLLLPMCQYLMR